MSEAVFKKLIEGKSIAIVGPSAGLLDFNQGEEIDKFDVLIRLRGNTLPISENLIRSIGARTDIIYTNFDNNFDKSLNNRLANMKIKHIRGTRAIEDIGNSWSYYDYILKSEKIPYSMPEAGKYYEWHKKLKASPHSGFCAILDLLSYDIKELKIFGYSFYKDNVIDQWANANLLSQENYKNDLIQVNRDAQFVSEKTDLSGGTYIDIDSWSQEVVHNNEKEFLYLKHIILNKDKRVRMGKNLKRIVELKITEEMIK
jgi:hypothetical protein